MMVKTKTNRAVKDILSDVVNSYEKMRPTIIRCINEDIFYPGQGEQILKDYRELKKSLENIDLEEG